MPNVESKGAPKGGRKLTKSLIAQRNLHIPIKIDAPENIWQALASLQVLRLDREGIGYIPNLQGLEHIHSIYLQQNQIEKIENLKCFSNLKFLTLAGNCISKVENLKDLLKLQFLDLSQNNIQILDIDELPHSLVILDLTGNKCTDQKNYRECVLDALPHLRELDRQRVPSRKVAVQDKKEEEEDSEDSDVDDCPELFQPLSAEKGFFVDLHNEFFGRSTRRREDAEKDHEAHLEELKQWENLRQGGFNTSQGISQAPSLSEPTVSGLKLQSQSCTISRPSLKATNPTFLSGLSAVKAKDECSSSTQQKTSKGEGSDKTSRRNVKK
uniref:Leucine rich repeat containing 46 n=1 Tax=Salvator merianae TaxID=96440 RepID=A0A8D0AXQ2_SALMN